MTYPVVNAGGFDMAVNEPATEMQRGVAGVPRDPGGAFRWFVRAPLRKEPWLAAVYLLIQFPIGIAAFVYATVMISVGAGTIVLALVGVALLVVFMYSLQPYGELRRQLSNQLLGTHIPPLPFQGESGPPWSLRRLKARITNPMTWRLLVYIFVSFPVAIAGLVIVTVLLSLPVGFLIAPIAGLTDGDIMFADTWQEGLFLVPLAVPVFFVSVALLWGTGWVAGLINRLFLETRYVGISEEGPTVLERARAAAGAWNNPGAPVILDSGTNASGGAPGDRDGDAGTVTTRVEAEKGLMVDVAMRRVRVDGRAVELTPKEFDLLTLFAQNPGRPFSRDDLLDRIWKNDYEVTDRTIDTHVQRLRKKLGSEAGVIQTVWGVGYRFEDSPRGARDGAEASEAPGAEEPGTAAETGW
jgi:DNA-binding winged helix-turn-helix (wHTH) protein